MGVLGANYRGTGAHYRGAIIGGQASNMRVLGALFRGGRFPL